VGSRIKQFALSYIKRGISFYPLSDHSKKPPIVGMRIINGKSKMIHMSWKKYQNELPTKYDIEHWFDIMKCQGLSICTGSFSGISVVDCDSDDAVNQFVSIFENNMRYSPFDLTHVRTKRGFHFYYKNKDKLKSNCLFGNDDIEFKSENLSIKAPPSLRDGLVYEFNGKGMIDLPEFIRFYIKDQSKKKIIQSKIYQKEYDRKNKTQFITDGTYWLDRALMRDDRNNACYAMCCQLRDDGLSLNDAEEIVEQYINLVDQSKDVFEINEGKSCLMSAWSQPKREPARKV